ncbi:MAG: ParM/StbA family protein [Peptostreptococcaceae bacterium]|nr:ParM/StbA family protein [Peptostreptococcaceae bacterium]
MKKFEINLKAGADNGNSEQDMIINGTQLQQADVYGRVVGRLKNLEELDQEKFINNLEDNLVIGIATSKYVNPGEYYVGNHTLRSGVTVRNTEVGADNNKVNSEVVYLNVIGQISAYAVKKAYKGDKTINDVEVTVDMTTALPIAQYSKKEAERFAEKFMEGEHRLTVKTPEKDYFVNIKFNFVRVIPEGVTTTFAIAGGSEEIFKTYNQKVKENLKDKKDSLYLEELNTTYFAKQQRRILHISIGESTTEYPITQGLAFDPNFVQGSNNGNGHAIKKALPLFNEEFRCNYSRQMYSDVVKNPEHKFHQDAVNYLMGPLEDEAEEIYRRAVDELEKANNEVDVIMIYGGGSILMREFLEPRLEEVARRIRSKILYVDKEHAVTLESKGLYNFTNSAIFKALKEKKLALAK